MNDKKEEKKVKVEISRGKSESQDESKPLETESGSDSDEKPLEEMSNDELLLKAKELLDSSNENLDKYLRAKAEIENILKRNKKEKEEWVKYSNETLIKEILPVIDNLELALCHSNNENSLQALREGVELTLKGLKDTLAKSGLEEVKAEGEAFDPCFHHVVSEMEDENVDSGRVLTELQKGYTLSQRLIRPAMVVLSKGTQKDKDSDIKPPSKSVKNK